MNLGVSVIAGCLGCAAAIAGVFLLTPADLDEGPTAAVAGTESRAGAWSSSFVAATREAGASSGGTGRDASALANPFLACHSGVCDDASRGDERSMLHTSSARTPAPESMAERLARLSANDATAVRDITAELLLCQRGLIPVDDANHCGDLRMDILRREVETRLRSMSDARQQQIATLWWLEGEWKRERLRAGSASGRLGEEPGSAHWDGGVLRENSTAAEAARSRLAWYLSGLRDDTAQTRALRGRVSDEAPAIPVADRGLSESSDAHWVRVVIRRED
ncbi:MAG: hypothetical protein RJA99_1730 [Pseudomonadota bacterium]|jgi:hypothetical protein